jgi:hypothetical protein
VRRLEETGWKRRGPLDEQRKRLARPETPADHFVHGIVAVTIIKPARVHHSPPLVERTSASMAARIDSGSVGHASITSRNLESMFTL